MSATLESKKHSGIIDISSKNTLEIKDKLVSLPSMSIEIKSGFGDVSRNKDTVSKNTEKVLECGPLESIFPCSESKILDFLITFQDYDYSISDIAKNAGVGFKTTLEVVKELEDHRMITNKRNVGRALMYKLNLDSKQTQSIKQLATHTALKRITQEKESNKMEEARCPKCQIHVHGQEEVKEKFGLRTRKGKQFVQSWCRECR